MATFASFEDIEAWQKSREFANQIYALHKNSPLKNDFILFNQLVKAAISISSNIAEGFERGGKNESIQFLAIAKKVLLVKRVHNYISLMIKSILTPTRFKNYLINQIVKEFDIKNKLPIYCFPTLNLKP